MITIRNNNTLYLQSDLFFYRANAIIAMHTHLVSYIFNITDQSLLNTVPIDMESTH